jgi:hypothetical protein
MPEQFNLNRRRFVETAAITVVAAQLGAFSCAPKSSSERNPTMAQTMAAGGTTAVRPFPHLDVPEAELVELRRRINATRWPTRELVTDDTQGIQLGTMQALARYWGTDYDWRKCETKLNALPQFMTEVDGQDIRTRSTW